MFRCSGQEISFTHTIIINEILLLLFWCEHVVYFIDYTLIKSSHFIQSYLRTISTEQIQIQSTTSYKLLKFTQTQHSSYLQLQEPNRSLPRQRKRHDNIKYYIKYYLIIFLLINFYLIVSFSTLPLSLAASLSPSVSSWSYGTAKFIGKRVE